MPPLSALEHLESLSRILRVERLGLFTDFDGTLTAIFDDPLETTLEPSMREALRAVSERLNVVAVVSGREVNYLRDAVGLDKITYAGNHGLEVWSVGNKMVKARAETVENLREDVGVEIGELGIEGLIVEDKGPVVSIHYRKTPETGLARSLILAMMRPFAEARGLRVREGKMVVELAPNVDVNKGSVIEELARDAGLTGAIALGDDITDCDAFDAVHRLGKGSGYDGAAVAVVDGETPPEVILKADYWLDGRGEVEEFLRWIAYDSPRAERKS